MPGILPLDISLPLTALRTASASLRDASMSVRSAFCPFGSPLTANGVPCQLLTRPPVGPVESKTPVGPSESTLVLPPVTVPVESVPVWVAAVVAVTLLVDARWLGMRFAGSGVADGLAPVVGGTVGVVVDVGLLAVGVSGVGPAACLAFGLLVDVGWLLVGEGFVAGEAAAAAGGWGVPLRLLTLAGEVLVPEAPLVGGMAGGAVGVGVGCLGDGAGVPVVVGFVVAPLWGAASVRPGPGTEALVVEVPVVAWGATAGAGAGFGVADCDAGGKCPRVFPSVDGDRAL